MTSDVRKNEEAKTRQFGSVYEIEEVGNSLSARIRGVETTAVLKKARHRHGSDPLSPQSIVPRSRIV